MAPTITKRKLRKTRRSLNEMRNRIYLAKNSKLNLSNMKRNAIIKPIISDICLLFPKKMVRSETITRKALYESKQTCTNMSMVDNKYRCNKVIDIVDCHSTTADSNTSKSAKLSSPIQVLMNDKTMSPSSHSERKLSENINDFFLSSFPKEINDIAPGLLSTDIIEKKKQSLKNIFSNLDMLSPPELSIGVKTIANNGSNSKAADISQLGIQADHKGLECQHIPKAYSRNTSTSDDSIHEAAIYISPTFKIQNVYDSPEFSYYPHRLNYQD